MCDTCTSPKKYCLFEIAAINTDTGDIWVEHRVVAATSMATARNQAVAAMVEAHRNTSWDGDPMELAEFFEVVTPVVRHFS